MEHKSCLGKQMASQSPIMNFFFFLLFHQFPDDEAIMNFLHIVRFFTISPTVLSSASFSFKSSLMLSSHVFRFLPLLLSPSMCPCRARSGNLSLFMLSTCPNHLSLLLRIFSTSVSSISSSFLVTSFL